jgi:hypothetical protein
VLLKTVKIEHHDNFRNVDFRFEAREGLTVEVPYKSNGSHVYYNRRYNSADMEKKFIILVKKTSGTKLSKKIGVRAYGNFDITFDERFDIGRNDMTRLAFFLYVLRENYGYLFQGTKEGEYIEYDTLYLDQAEYLVKRWIRQNVLEGLNDRVFPMNSFAPNAWRAD